MFFPSVQILTEQVCTQVVHKPHPEPDSTVKIQNPSEYLKKHCGFHLSVSVRPLLSQ